VNLHAEVVGRGPALVLLHGWGLHSGIWTPLGTSLAKDFRVTTIDLPGHGRSPASARPFGLEEVAAWVAALAPAGAAWLGWSLGGQIALAAALAGADIHRLALIATTPRFVSGPDWPCGMSPSVLAGFASSLAADHRKTVRDFLALQLRGDRRAASLLAEMRQVLAERPEPDAPALAAALDILAATDLRDRLAAVRQPALVVSGERDRLTPAEAGRRLAAGLPGGRFIALQGAAHAPFLSHPDEVRVALTRFLREGVAA
jgi:pimeloyl-[acyl-carrier protein] methyl ester esterase